LRSAATYPGPQLAHRVWLGLEMVLAMWRWRDRPRLIEVCTDGFGDLLVETLMSTRADSAAGLLVWLEDTGPGPALMTPLRGAIVERLPAVPESARLLLMPWIDSSGLTVAPAPQPPGPSVAEEDLPLATVVACTDLDQLERWVREGSLKVKQAAVELLRDRGP